MFLLKRNTEIEAQYESALSSLLFNFPFDACFNNGGAIEDVRSKIAQTAQETSAQNTPADFSAEVVKSKFWEKDNDNGKTSIKIVEFLAFLCDSGFRIFRIDVKNNMYVQVRQNVVKEVSTADIKHYVINFVEANTGDKNAIKTAIFAYTRLFADSTLDFLPFLTQNFRKDSKETAYFYFQNVYVEVSKNGIVAKEYKDLQGLIWEKQKIKHDYCPIKISSNFSYWQFFQNVCKKAKDKDIDQDRIKSLQSILGYMMHDYKEKTKAVCFTDSVISDDPEGRTGKGIVANSIQYLRVQTYIDGKKFKFDSEFAFQKVNLNTQTIFLDDVGRKGGFNVEPLFSAISENLEVQKKNQTTFDINAKFILTSNRALVAHGGSAKDRIIEFEFSNYYSTAFNPSHEFGGKWFFKDFSTEEWQQFYSFMLLCSHEYFSNGITMTEELSLSERRLIDNTTGNSDFKEFADDLPINTDIEKKETLEKFKELSTDYEKISQNTLTRYLKLYAKEKGMSYNESRVMKENKQIHVFSFKK